MLRGPSALGIAPARQPPAPADLARACAPQAGVVAPSSGDPGPPLTGTVARYLGELSAQMEVALAAACRPSDLMPNQVVARVLRGQPAPPPRCAL